MAVTRAFAKSGPAFDAEIDPLIDNDEWMRAMAFESLCGISDIFSRENGHNVNFYQRPKDRMNAFRPETISGRTSSLGGTIDVINDTDDTVLSISIPL